MCSTSEKSEGEDAVHDVFDDEAQTSLNGEPLNLVTRSGVEEWHKQQETYSVEYDTIYDDEEGVHKARTIFAKHSEETKFVLVDDSGLEVVLNTIGTAKRRVQH